MKGFIKEEKDMPIFFKEWCNATKMRRWLQDKKNSDGLDLTNRPEDEEKLNQIITGVISKAEFLIKIEKPTVFQSINPDDEILNQLSYRIPSYARDHKMDQEELKMSEEVKQNP